MNATTLARIFGVVFVAIGVLGFVPGITTDGSLLGIFEVNALHNLIHIITGVAALAMAGSSAKMFFKVFGVVYLLVTIIGFLQGDTVLGLIGVNMADNLLHLVIAGAALYFGFKGESTM